MDKVFATLRTFGVLLGLWAILAGVGIAMGVVPLPGDVRRTGEHAEPEAVADAGAPDAGVEEDVDPTAPEIVAPAAEEPPDAADAEAPEEVPAAPAASVTEGVRWSICAPSAEPSLAVADVFGDSRPELVVGCEDGWHVIGLSSTGPARVAIFTAPAAPTEETRVAGRAGVGDVDGDGHADLVLPLAFAGENGVSRGGGLFWVPGDAYGGIREPHALAPIAAVAVSVAPLDGEGGAEIVAMNRANALAQLASEAWVFTGGPSPTRLAALVSGLDGSSVGVVDLDRDGNADVMALSPGRVDLHFGPTFERNHTLELEGAREAASGDVDGDGAEDLVVLGGGLRWIRAGALGGMEPRGVDGVPANLRGLQAMDVDGDGKLDLVGWDHPRLVILRQRDPVDFEPVVGFTLSGGPFGPRRHQVVDLDADGSSDDLVLLGTVAGEGAPLEVILLTDALGGMELTPAAEARVVPDAPLVVSATLPL